jgi:hypothetical protein
MLRQPADPPPPLGHVGTTEVVQSFQRAWSNSKATPRRSLRAWAGRISGRADRHLLHALAETTNAMVMQCDLLADRISAREAVSAEVADALGEELALLRGEVSHLHRLVGSPPEPPDA